MAQLNALTGGGLNRFGWAPQGEFDVLKAFIKSPPLLDNSSGSCPHAVIGTTT